jgi:hypothetical protein
MNPPTRAALERPLFGIFSGAYAIVAAPRKPQALPYAQIVAIAIERGACASGVEIHRRVH